jgi:uncharacterized protein YndB with AHSA1/START domain
MPRTSPDAAEPIRRSVSVSWSPEAAFQRFTAEFATWWPRYSNSIGGRRVKRIVFEARVGGRIYEEHHDGTRFAWGTVTALEPPRRVAFTFHATRAESDAQEVEVSFTPDGTGTHVELVSRGWEKMSRDANRARGGYRLTWGIALDKFASRLSGPHILFVAMAATIDLIGQRGTFVRDSLGRMPSVSRAGGPPPD